MDALIRPRVRVMMRFRPMNAEEMVRHEEQGDGRHESCVRYDEDCVEIVERFSLQSGGHALPAAIDVHSAAATPRELTKRFTFDAVLSEFMTQPDVYERVGEPLVASVMRGYNGAILAYGQTGSGKTHSMVGPDGGRANVFSPRSPLYEMRGLIPRMVEGLFEKLGRLDPLERTWRVTVSMFEVYMETIVDLLCCGPQKSEYRIREDTLSGGVQVDSVERVECHSAAQAMELVRGGMLRRHTATTNCNETSSRSHCLLCISLEQNDAAAQKNGSPGMGTMSRLYLVDLAGSEKVCKTLAEGSRLKEAQRINLSLTLLGNVIHRLTDGKLGYIPYRDSKLTHVLQDAFGGNSLTTLLCHGSVSALSREETLSTARFAQRAKRMRNKPRVNCSYALQERLRLQKELLEAKRLAQANLSMRDELDRRESLVSSLMKEVERLKEDLQTKEKSFQQQRDRAMFYKQQCAELTNELADVSTKHMEENERLLGTLRTVEAERDYLVGMLEELQENHISNERDSWRLSDDEEDVMMSFDHHPSSKRKAFESLTKRFTSPVVVKQDDTVRSDCAQLASSLSPPPPLFSCQRQRQKKREATRDLLEKGVMTDLTGDVLQAMMDGKEAIDCVDKAGDACAGALDCHATQAAEFASTLFPFLDTFTAQFHEVVQPIADDIFIITKRNSVQHFQAFERKWGHLLGNTKPFVRTMPRDVLRIIILHAARYILLMNATKNGLAGKERVLDGAVSCCPAVSATERLGGAFGVFSKSSGASIGDGVTIFDDTLSGTRVDRPLRDRTLDCMVERIGAEMLRVLLLQPHGCLTFERIILAPSLQETRVHEVWGTTTDVLQATVQREILKSVMEPIKAVVCASCESRTEGNSRAVVATENLAAERVRRALCRLWSCVARSGEGGVDLLNAYYGEETLPLLSPLFWYRLNDALLMSVLTHNEAMSLDASSLNIIRNVIATLVGLIMRHLSFLLIPQLGTASAITTVRDLDAVASGCELIDARDTLRPCLTGFSVHLAATKTLATEEFIAAGTGEPRDVTSISFADGNQEPCEELRQAIDSAAESEVYVRCFGRNCCMSERTEVVAGAADVTDLVSEMQQVPAPVLQQELIKVHNALGSLRQFVQAHPCTPPGPCGRRSMPELFRQKVLGDDTTPPKGTDSPPRQTRVPICATDAQRVVDEVVAWFRAWQARHERVTRHDRGMTAHVKRLAELLDATRRERDDCREDIDALKRALEKLREDNTTMRVVLESLHVDLETSMERVRQQQAVNASLRAEADALKGAAADLRLTADQVEFCEMAGTELRMKMEDLRGVQTEVVRMGALRSADLVRRKQKLLRSTLCRLEKFAQKTLAMLPAHRQFNTGTLESQRLTLLESVNVFIAKVHETRESLGACRLKCAPASYVEHYREYN